MMSCPSLAARVLLAASMAASASAVTAREPDFRAPPGAAVQLVGEQVVIQNRPTHVRQFYTRDTVERVNEFYRQLWAEEVDGREPGYVETDAMSPWHLITRVEDDWLMTVQVQKADDGGSWGYLARSRLLEEPPNVSRPPDMPGMRDSEVLNHQQSVDIGQKADTLMMTNRYSLKSNIEFYKKYYADRGWREDMDKALLKAKSHILSYTSNRRTVNIVLTGDHRSTRVVMNRVIHDLL